MTAGETIRTRRRRLPHAIPALVALATLVPFLHGCVGPKEIPPPPPTRVEPVVETIHGVKVTDPYRWLEDQNSPETRRWIEAQNAYTDRLLSMIHDRPKVEERVTELLETETIGVPVERGGRYFFTRRAADQDLPVILVREGAEGKERVLVDPNGMTPDNSRSATLEAVSRSGLVLAYGLRDGGQDEIEVRFLDVRSGEDYPDVLPKMRVWSIQVEPDDGGFFYTRFGKEGPRVFHHRFGSPENGDRLVFGEGLGREKIIETQLSDDGRYLVVNVATGSAGQRGDIYLVDLRSGRTTTVVDDLEARSVGEIHGGTLYIQTNWDAPDGRIFAADPRRPGRSRWREVVPQREGAVIRGFTGAGGHLLVNYVEDVQSRVRIFLPDGTPAGEIRFDTVGSVGAVRGRWDSDEVFYSFSSFHVPPTIYRRDLTSGESSVWARVRIPFSSQDYRVEQVRYRSKDGTEVPMFVVHRKGIERDGNNPTLLFGYGGFNISLTPRYSPRAVAWLAAGGVFAVANLRGGGELGEAWHRAGMLGDKQNTFDDFIAAAEWLTAEGYTRPDRLAIMGGSNGGLLVGAAVTQRPELFQAAVCAYPLLDMVRYDKFLVAKLWVPEYGSADDPEQFRWLYAYSPYHHVKDGTRYPAMLFVSGDGDTRVAPLHARKMTARMQAAAAPGRPICLRYHVKAGHSAGQPLGERVRDLTDMVSFLLWQLGAIS